MKISQKKLEELDESDLVYEIKIGGKSQFHPDDFQEFMDGVPVGGVISWNDSMIGELVDEYNKPMSTKEATLAHELLGHAYDSLKGAADFSDPQNLWTPSYEANAVVVENRVLDIQGRETRDSYLDWRMNGIERIKRRLGIPYDF